MTADPPGHADVTSLQLTQLPVTTSNLKYEPTAARVSEPSSSPAFGVAINPEQEGSKSTHNLSSWADSKSVKLGLCGCAGPGKQMGWSHSSPEAVEGPHQVRCSLEGFCAATVTAYCTWYRTTTIF